MITKTQFGKMPNGEQVYSYVLDNNKGVKVEILSYGGIIKSILVKDKNGIERDVVLGRDTLEEYFDNNGYFGAAIGRHANRIKEGKFILSGKEYSVGINEGKNSLHGGKIGFDKKVWDVKESGTENEPAIIMSLTSPDGEEGFPGELKVTMTYTLTQNNGLNIHYEAVCDKDTVVNMTNHSYFNLAGHESGNIYDHVLKINSNFVTPNDSECMPTGQVWSVKNTAFDFTTPKKVGKDINDPCGQIQAVSGFDHNYAIEGRGYREAAVLKCEESGITMTVMTDKPAMQLYTGNALEKGRVCKNSVVYDKHQGLCLETQYFPNAMAHSHYPAPILLKGDKYDFTTEYIFTVE